MNTDNLLSAIDRLVRGHARLVLDQSPSDAKLAVDRYGWIASVTVRLQGSRKRACRIHADGDSPEAAVQALGASLDSWVAVW